MCCMICNNKQESCQSVSTLIYTTALCATSTVVKLVNDHSYKQIMINMTKYIILSGGGSSIVSCSEVCRFIVFRGKRGDVRPKTPIAQPVCLHNSCKRQEMIFAYERPALRSPHVQGNGLQRDNLTLRKMVSLADDAYIVHKENEEWQGILFKCGLCHLVFCDYGILMCMFSLVLHKI